MLIYRNEELFATSRTPYLDQMPGHPGNRIWITVQFSDLVNSSAIVDTGAPWCVLSKQEASVFDPKYLEKATEQTVLNIRGWQTNGVLVRWPITLCAEEGIDIKIEGTVFVPDDDLPVPNFIGLDGFLSRIKFAVDPQNNDFFFGPI